MQANVESPRQTSVGTATFTLRPPATLFFSDTAVSGLKVRYVRHVHADTSAAPAGGIPAAGTGCAVASA